MEGSVQVFSILHYVFNQNMSEGKHLFPQDSFELIFYKKKKEFHSTIYRFLTIPFYAYIDSHLVTLVSKEMFKCNEKCVTNKSFWISSNWPLVGYLFANCH